MENKIKIIIVSSNTQEFEKMLNNGWAIIQAFQFNKGLMVILKK